SPRRRLRTPFRAMPAGLPRRRRGSRCRCDCPPGWRGRGPRRGGSPGRRRSDGLPRDPLASRAERGEARARGGHDLPFCSRRVASTSNGPSRPVVRTASESRVGAESVGIRRILPYTFRMGRRAVPGRVLSVLPFYVGIVAIRWWPLPVHLDEQLPYIPPLLESDRLYSMWTLAWSSHTLSTHPTHLADANIYFPVPDALFYGPTGVGALPLFAPVYLLSGSAVGAINITFLASIALTAWTLHLLVHRWTGSHLAGAVAACSLFANGWLTCVFVPTAPHLAVLQYWPLIIGAAAAPAASLGAPFTLWALVLVQCLTDVVYVAPALLAPLALLGVVRLARRATRGAGMSLLLVVLLAAASLLPIYRAHWRVAAANPRLSQQAFWS